MYSRAIHINAKSQSGKQTFVAEFQSGRGSPNVIVDPVWRRRAETPVDDVSGSAIICAEIEEAQAPAETLFSDLG